MRQQKELPFCVGRRSILNKKIPVDKLEVLDKQSNKPDLGWYLCIGYSQWSGRMERMGYVPICIRGSEIHVGKKVIPQKRKEEEDEYDVKREFARGKDNEKQGVTPQQQKQKQDLLIPQNAIVISSAALVEKANRALSREGIDEMKETAEWLRRAMIKSSKRQYEAGKEFIGKTAEKFPEKFHSSVTNLVSSTSKTASTIYKTIKTYINNIGGGGGGGGVGGGGGGVGR